MGKTADYLRLKTDFDLARYQFVVTELDMAITFCQIALSADSQSKLERNVDHATRAYDAATRFLDCSSLTEEMRDEVRERVSSLQQLRAQLSLNGHAPEG
jgi:hypothetical protein